MSDTANQKFPLPRMLSSLPAVPPEAFAPPTERERLSKLAEELDRKALDEIALRFTHLNFGEMTELAEGIGAEPAKIWAWATRDKQS